MNKKILILLILICLSGCNENIKEETSSPSSNKEYELENFENADLFTKKNICYSFQEEANDKVIIMTRGAYTETHNLFYSPKLDTCLFSYGECGYNRCFLVYVDFFTGKVIDSINCHMCEIETGEFKGKINELK